MLDVNHSSNIFEKYIDSEWRACDASNTLDELIKKGYKILNAHYTEHFMNDPDIYENEDKLKSYDRFRFLGDISWNEYYAVKRELRLLVKDRTMYVLSMGYDDTETANDASETTNDVIE